MNYVVNCAFYSHNPEIIYVKAGSEKEALETAQLVLGYRDIDNDCFKKEVICLSDDNIFISRDFIVNKIKEKQMSQLKNNNF